MRPRSKLWWSVHHADGSNDWRGIGFATLLVFLVALLVFGSVFLVTYWPAPTAATIDPCP